MPHQSPLYETHKVRGARFGEFGTCVVAEEYEGARKEYDAVRHRIGALDLCCLGRLRATGQDRVRYFHNMLSNDIRKLTDGTGCYATLLTRQGRMESDLYIYACAEELFVECPPAGAGRVFETLDKYIVGDVVQIEDLSDKFAMLSLQGPGSRETMEYSMHVSLDGLPLLGHKTVGGSPGGRRIVHRDRTGCDGYDLWLPRGEAAQVWTEWLDVEGIQPVGHVALNWLRTEHGIPWFGVDMDTSNLPMEFGLDSAISTTKGCYRGQEIVTRVLHRGHLDRRLGGLAVEHTEPPARGSEVRLQGTKVGEISSASFSPRLGRPLALAVLKVEYLNPGTVVEVLYGDKTRAAEVVALPLS